MPILIIFFTRFSSNIFFFTGYRIWVPRSVSGLSLPLGLWAAVRCLSSFYRDNPPVPICWLNSGPEKRPRRDLAVSYHVTPPGRCSHGLPLCGCYACYCKTLTWDLGAGWLKYWTKLSTEPDLWPYCDLFCCHRYSLQPLLIKGNHIEELLEHLVEVFASIHLSFIYYNKEPTLYLFTHIFMYFDYFHCMCVEFTVYFLLFSLLLMFVHNIHKLQKM